MTRTAARELAVQLAFRLAQNPVASIGETIDEFFEREYYDTLSKVDELPKEFPEKKQIEYIRRLAEGAERHRGELDGYISTYSRGWKVSRISKTALAVLRVALYEILYMEDIPNSAAINEAVELCKGYDDEETVAFVNGVLGGFMRGELGDGSAEEAIADKQAPEEAAADEAEQP